jgi:formylglycine-generating enzyme required for sulfatase activity
MLDVAKLFTIKLAKQFCTIGNERMATLTNRQLREFILASFNDDEFDIFCFDYFEGVEHNFSDDMSMMKKVMELIAYCKRLEKMSHLLDALQKERTSTYQNLLTQLQNIDETPTPAPQRQVSDVKVQPAPQPDFPQETFIHEKTGLEFVKIPTGEFLYSERNFRISLPEFWISKTPVTFAVYQQFIRENPDYPVPFLDEDWAEPYNWEPKWRSYPADKAEHPVVSVTWYDAVAFCKWAGMQLPTEEQWEKAARGSDGRFYPWGNHKPTNKLCNFGGHMSETTPVGHYAPQGNSPYGCVDMSGNVWEWCLNKFETREDLTIDESNDPRVVRGGSWYTDEPTVDATLSVESLPDLYDTDSGFRVALDRPPFQDQ